MKKINSNKKRILYGLSFVFTLLFLQNSFFCNGQTTVTIGTGTNGLQTIPLCNMYFYSASEMIYLKDEINLCGGGSISKIRFYTSFTGGTILDNFTLYLKHTTNTTLATGTTTTTGYTSVYSGSFPNTATGWNEITLSTPFSYNGTDNIQVLVVKNKNSNNSSNTTIFYTSTGANLRTRWWGADPSGWTTSTTLSAIADRPNIQFDITPIACSGTPDPGATVSTQNYACVGKSFTLSVQNCVSNTGTTYQWQECTDNVTWVNISGATLITCTKTQDATALMYYRCKVTCSNSGLTGYSASTTVTKLTACPTYYVGAGQTYTSLTANTAQGLFKKIYTSGLAANTKVVITSDINEPGDVALTQWSTGSAYKLLITSDDAVQHSITCSAANTLIDLNGADNVTIDGREDAQGVGNYLLFESTYGGYCTILFRNSAIKDTVRYCTIKGSGGWTTSYGVIGFFTSASGTGNDNNCIEYCDIMSGASLTSTLIYSRGSYDPAVISNDNISINNNTIGHYSGGSMEADHGAIWLHWYSNTFSIKNNYIYNDVNVQAASNIGITIGNGTGHLIEGNRIGGSAKDGSGTWLVECSFLIGISSYYNNSGGLGFTGSAIIRNNVIANMKTTSGTYNGTGLMWGIMDKSNTSAGNSLLIESNSIYNLESTQVGSSSEGIITGIMISMGNNKTVTKNTIHDLNATNGGNNDNYVCGIMIRTPGSNFKVQANKIYNLSNASINANSKINGITASLNTAGTDFSSPYPLISNNMISLINNNRPQTNGVFTNTTTSINNNTIYVGGVGPVSHPGSYCLNLDEAKASGNATTDYFRNNLFFNNKTGVGECAAIKKANTVNASYPIRSNYNFLVTANSAKIARVGATNYSFANWKALQTGLDANSWSVVSTTGSSDNTNINPADLFVDYSNCDLHIKTSNEACWFVNGKGIATSTLNRDFDENVVGSVYGFGIDIGADEFDPATGVEPHTLTAASNPFEFSFAGRHLATINFTAGTNPTSMNLRYYSGEGVIDPTPVTAEFFDSYMHVWPTGGSAYKYTITIDYDEALLGGLVETTPTVDENEEIMARRDRMLNKWYKYFDANCTPISSRNVSNNTLTCTGLTLFSDFTGTKESNPLPIELEEFTANCDGNYISLNWTTASETNNDFFTVEKSSDNQNWLPIITIAGAGNSNQPLTYSAIDYDVTSTVVYFYRLVDTDFNGKKNYSYPIFASCNKNDFEILQIFPNPSQNEINFIVWSTENTEIFLTVIDELGRIIKNYKQNIQTGANQLSIDLNGCSDGFYVLSAETTNFLHKDSKQLIIKR